jgi:hypothetical protein
VDHRAALVSRDTGPRLLAHVTGGLLLAVFLAAIWTRFWVATAGWGFLATFGITLGVGWFLTARLPRNPIGWLLMLVVALFALELPCDLIGQALLPVAPEPAAWLLSFGHGRADLDTWSWVPPIGLMFTQIPLRFPTGHLLTPGWRWFSRYTIVALILSTVVLSTMTTEVYPGAPNPVHLDAMVGPLPFQIAVMAPLFLSAIIGSLASLIVRYRGGAPQERAQIRWVAWSVPFGVAALAIDASTPTEFAFVHDWVNLLLALIPISIGVAVLRYRLWAIDRIISRTASYAIVTVVVAGVYVGVVLGIGLLLPGLPSVGVALATLAAAAVVLPLFRWVRGWVDRRFDRARYDAQRVVEVFGERLRNGADPHTASADLADAIRLTLQPSAMGIWTSEGSSWNRT